VARDYIHQARPQLGFSRLGPDLTNLAGRKPSAPDTEDLMKLLYAGTPAHPSYRFLFETRRVVGEPSAQAVKLTGNLAAPAGHEVVPSERARSLVTYLLSLNTAYDYPESRPVPKPEAKGAGKKAAPAAGKAPEAAAKAPEAKQEAKK
jgi:cytochrome c oxidase cbb3-type subunit 2